MPNWVSNTVVVSGKREDLIAFAEKAKQPHESEWLSDEWVFDKELGKNVKIPFEERKIEKIVVTPDAFSFWNFVAPTDEELPYYFGQIEESKPEGFDDWTMEQRLAHSLKFSGRGWYDWNVTNWGTKWNANDDTLLNGDLDKLEPFDSITYCFDTAWGIPEPIFRAMVEQHPELDFDFESVEEQGWGAKFTSSDGDGERSLIETESWEIPNSHSDYAVRGNEESCVCAWESDTEEWYDDCPNKVVKVVAKEELQVIYD